MSKDVCQVKLVKVDMICYSSFHSTIERYFVVSIEKPIESHGTFWAVVMLVLKALLRG